MSEVVAIAISRPHSGKHDEFVAIVRELAAFLRDHGYGHDALYRDTVSGEYITVRRWTSREKALEAHADPKLHAFWNRLGKVATTVKIHERLDEIHIS